jgi:hypothetical protein
VETYLIVKKGHVKKASKPKRQSLRQAVLERLEFSNASKLGISIEEEGHQIKRKRSKTENNVHDTSPVSVARARLSLAEDSSLISNHGQPLPYISISIDDVETTKSKNSLVSEKVCLFLIVNRFL